MDKFPSIEARRSPHSGQTLTLLANTDQIEKTELIFKALGSAKRIAILNHLTGRFCSVLEIAEALNMPFTTATQHINILQKAGLIETDLQPSRRGIKKVCRRVFDHIEVYLPTGDGSPETH